TGARERMGAKLLVPSMGMGGHASVASSLLQPVRQVFSTSGRSYMHTIAIVPGDGIGPEVMAHATRLLEHYRDDRRLPLELWQLDLGAERFLRDGTTFPKDVRDRIATQTSAVLLGALGDPRVPNLEYARDILFGLRFGLDLYANVRPVKALVDRLVP